MKVTTLFIKRSAAKSLSTPDRFSNKHSEKYLNKNKQNKYKYNK